MNQSPQDRDEQRAVEQLVGLSTNPGAGCVRCQYESDSIKNRFRQKLVKQIVKVPVLQVAKGMVEEARDSPEDCGDSTNVIP